MAQAAANQTADAQTAETPSNNDQLEEKRTNGMDHVALGNQVVERVLSI